jgi:DnaJ-class molecular chaperone
MTPDEQEAEERSTCTPCRGTGRVSSSLGGEPHEVTCPWCDGTGRFQPGHDAQAAGGEEKQGATGGEDPAAGDEEKPA